MSSPTPSLERNAKAPTSKSKQERIRDNQRRSRARKQEYLADLEKRLRDTHSAFRDADMQRLAFTDLQKENGHLRQLLTLAGVSGSTVDAYLLRSTSPQPGPNQSVTMRPLRPKFLPVPSEVSAVSPSSGSRSRSVSALPEERLVLDPEQPVYFDGDGSNFSSGLAPSNSVPSSRLPVENVAPATAPDPSWMFEQWGSHGADDSDFGFGPVSVPTNKSLQQANSNGEPCTAAKDLVQQWTDVSLEDLNDIKLRLTDGFGKSAACDGGCRINHQLLIHLLNEYNAKRQ